MGAKIVLHYLTGQIIKGTTMDFAPNRSWFRFTDRETGKTLNVDLLKLKGIFFVKDYEGVPTYGERYHIGQRGLGTKIKVLFKDGEAITGYTPGVSPGRIGFFLFPADPHSNTLKVFAITNATQEILME
jgi:hypothetical protein